MNNRYRVCVKCGEARKLKYGTNKARLPPFCHSCAVAIIKAEGIIAYRKMRDNTKLIIEKDVKSDGDY